MLHLIQALHMKKNLLSLFFILIVHTSSFSQEGLLQFTKSYFRSDPFIGEFSSFLKHLMNDPLLKDKKTWTRTDTSLFYFSGVFNNYNPFFFKPKRVEVVLVEAPVQYSESMPADTILVYQLLAYAEGSHKGEQEVKKEFEKIHRQFNKKFYDSNFQELLIGSEIKGGVHNYFIGSTTIAPISVAWGKLKENEFVLNLMLRIKTKENIAVLPATLYNP